MHLYFFSPKISWHQRLIGANHLTIIHPSSLLLLLSSPPWKVSHEWKPVPPTFLTIIRPTPTKPAGKEGHHREIGTWHDKWKSLMKLSRIIPKWQSRSCNRGSEMIFKSHKKTTNIEIWSHIRLFSLQDVVYALAHATGKTGRFTLIERWRNNERLLAPQEHPLKVRERLCLVRW